MNLIINPLTNEKYSIFSNDGINLLKKYIINYQSGGSDKATKDIGSEKATKDIGSENYINIKPTKESESGEKKSVSEIGRQPLCVLHDYEYIGRLGDTGLEGEVWKVKHKETDKFYACKIFESHIPKEKIRIEAECIRKMGQYNVSPKLIKVMDHCIIMEMVNGIVLAEYMEQNNTYDEAIINNLLEIAHALIKSNIQYNDLNVKYNIMFDKDKKKLILIDFGLLLTNEEREDYISKLKEKKKEYTQQQLDKDIATICAFNIILEVERHYMLNIYGLTDYRKTPLMLGFIPPDYLSNFPTILNYIDKDLLHLLDYTVRFGQHKQLLDKKIARHPRVFNYEEEYKKLEELIQKYTNVAVVQK